MGCEDYPRRYLVVFMGFIGLLVSIGYRSVFTMVMVHITATGVSDFDSLFKNCSNSSETNFHKDWDSKQVFLLYTGYFAGTIVTQLPGGLLAARFSSKRVCGVVILLTSILMLLLPVVIERTNYYVLMTFRVVQGILEGCSVPALNGTISAWAPKCERSRLITLAYAGAYLSPALAMLLTGLTTCYVSWYAILYIYGGVGVIWSLMWMIIIKDTPSDCGSLGRKEKSLFERDGPAVKKGNKHIAKGVPWCSMIRSLPVSAILVGAFCRNWIFSLLITGQPQYFRDVFRMPSAMLGLVSAVPHVLMTCVVITGGVLVDTLIKRKYVSVTVGRKLSQTLGFGVEGGCILALGLIKDNDWRVALTLLCVGVAISGFAISGYQVNPLDLAPQYCSVLTGIARLGCCGAILSTLVASIITHTDDKSIAWNDIFIIAGSLHLAGVVYYAVFASGQRQPWADGHKITATMDADTGQIQYDELNSEDEGSEQDQLLRQSLPTGFYDAKDDEFGSSMRFLNSI